ncbi:MAG: acyl-CoA dehydrogenase [Deltaproteobacteria bacterium]|nr:acyl-CoA dehydrogenase [Deltaproteobacteria bacterium]
MFRIEERDIRFNLFDYLDLDSLLKLPAFADLDRDTIEILLSNAFKVAKEVIAPLNQPGDKEGCKIDKNGNVTVPEGYKQAYESYGADGWISISSPVEFGGTGAPSLVGIASGEASASASTAFTMYPGLTRGAASLIIDEGSEEQKQMFVEKMLNGTWGGTMCLTEAGAGSAVGDSRAMATKIREGWYKIKGQKIFISSGDHNMTENNIHLVLARTPNAPVGIKGLSIFIVPKYRVNEDGSLGKFNDVVCANVEHKMGIKGSATCTLEFGDNDDCEGWLIGNEGDGIQIMFHMMNEARLGVGLQGLAVAAAAYNEALDYARERIQGVDMRNFKDPNAPRVAIIEHPDVRRMLLTQRAYVHGCRALIYKVASYIDYSTHAEGEVKEKAKDMLDLLTPIAKAYVTDQGLEVTRLAMQTFGGYGYISEYPVEQYMRDCRILSIYEGTNGIQSMDLVGRKLGSKGGMVFMSFLAELQAYLAKAKENEVTKDYVGEFEQSITDIQTLAMTFMEKNMKGDVLYVLQYSAPFLRFMGNMIMSWLLGEQAMVAAKRLKALYAEKGAKTGEEKAALLKENEEAAFLDAKLTTSRFFTVNLLPENRSLTQSMVSNDTSVLDIVF